MIKCGVMMINIPGIPKNSSLFELVMRKVHVIYMNSKRNLQCVSKKLFDV